MKAYLTPQLIEHAACTCYEAYRGYGLGAGEVDLNTWQIAERENKEATRYAVETFFQNPDTTAEQIHDAWVQRKTAEGWKYGATDRARHTHAWLLPFTSLNLDQRMQYHLWKNIVEAFRQGFSA